MNGELVGHDAAVVAVADHGLVVGDGVFETVHVLGGRPFALARHLARLARSAEGLGIDLVPVERLERAIAAVVGSFAPVPAVLRVRLTITSGPGPLGSGRGPGPPTVVVCGEPEADVEPAPAAVAVAPWTRNEHGATAGLKTTSYAENTRALAWAAARGCEEAVFANTAGRLCEGTGSNVFVVANGALSTPTLSSGCLAGVTRELLLEVTDAVEADLPIDAFAPGHLTEAFLTSTVRGVQPIASIDGRGFAPVPGPHSLEASRAFAALVASGREFPA